MFREVFGVVPGGPELAASEENHRDGNVRLKCGSPFNGTPGTASSLLYPQSPQKLECYKSPPVIWEHLSFVPSYS